MRVLPLAILFAFFLLGSCVEGSARPDAGLSPDATSSVVQDAAPRPDADPSCSVWRLASAPIASVTLLETAPIRVGRSARVRLEVEHCPGDDLGPWGYAPTLDNEGLSLHSQVWRSGNDCESPEIVSRDIVLRFPYAATWYLNGGAALTIEVLAEASGACNSAPADTCQRDCDCQSGEQCLSGVNSEGSFTRCAQACEFARECGGQGICGDENGLEGVCLRDVAECQLPERPCEEDFECAEGTCEPSFRLNQLTRHECSCDNECDPGLRCVEGLRGRTVSGRCEAVCLTPYPGWCEGAHICNG